MADLLIAIALLVVLALALERNHRRHGSGPERPGLSRLDLRRIRTELDRAVNR